MPCHPTGTDNKENSVRKPGNPADNRCAVCCRTTKIGKAKLGTTPQRKKKKTKEADRFLLAAFQVVPGIRNRNPIETDKNLIGFQRPSVCCWKLGKNSVRKRQKVKFITEAGQGGLESEASH